MDDISCSARFVELGKDGYSAEDFETFSADVVNKRCNYDLSAEEAVGSQLHNLVQDYFSFGGSPSGIHDNRAYDTFTRLKNNPETRFHYFGIHGNSAERERVERRNANIHNLATAVGLFIVLPAVVLSLIGSPSHRIPLKFRRRAQLVVGGLLFASGIGLALRSYLFPIKQ